MVGHSVGHASESQLAPIKAEGVLAFNWRQLTALGVSLEEARSIATTLITKRLMLLYWQRLVQQAVPHDDARRIARAIAKYDVMEILPTLHQRELIQRRCPAICRCGLWRVGLLLPPASETGCPDQPLQ